MFNRDHANYCNFVQSFTNLIEVKTTDSKMRLHYLVQYTPGDVHDLMKSCLAMKSDRGYIEACHLLKERYGQGYKITATLVELLINGHPQVMISRSFQLHLQGPFETHYILFGWTVNSPLVRIGQLQPVCNFVRADEKLNQ